MLVVITMGLLCWNIKLNTEIKTTEKTLSQTIDRTVDNSNAINEIKGVNVQLFQLKKRIDDIEVWIWNFEDIMFGPTPKTAE